MKPLSSKLRGYSGANPFRESQARTYGDDKILNEFYPTTFYWSLFNEQHEILLGTRGSGKTVLLRMLTYSLLKRFQNEQALRHIEEKRFIGFYVPLHLEFIDELQNLDATVTERIQYFQFAFNCSASKSLLDQIPELLLDCYPETRERFIAESKIVEHLTSIWFPDLGSEISSISDLQWKINILYNTHEFSTIPKQKDTQAFFKPILMPLTGVLPKLTEDLGLNINTTNWIICIDEAEFLQEPFIKCINTFMRSEKRPIVIKMATLPFKHSTRETLQGGIYIEPNGSDFNYRKLDMEWDSTDFIGLTNHLCKVRLRKCEIKDETLTLDQFLGVEGKDDAIDYFKAAMGANEVNKDKILKGLLEALSGKRRRHYPDVQNDIDKVERPLIHRFTPVYMVRKIKIADSKGNRTVGWFAGPQMVRRIADGNPRRFIQIMNDLVEKARDADLTPRNQHRVLRDFAERYFIACEGLPKYGLAVKNILNKIGDLLSDRVHGIPMKDGGCNFYLDRKLIDNITIKQSIELAIDYSYIVPDNDSLFTDITEDSNLRLSFLCAVYFWLPMRKGDSPVVRQTESLLNINLPYSVPITRKESDIIFAQLNLELMDQINLVDEIK